MTEEIGKNTISTALDTRSEDYRKAVKDDNGDLVLAMADKHINELTNLKETVDKKISFRREVENSKIAALSACGTSQRGIQKEQKFSLTNSLASSKDTLTRG